MMTEIFKNNFEECTEIYNNFKQYVHKDDVFLDIGYCYGEYSLLLNIPIIGFEACKKDFDYKRSIDKIFYKAVIKDNENIQIEKKNDTCDKVTHSDTTHNIETISFKQVMKYYFTILKIDVEGYEWYYDFSLVPNKVHTIIIEQHYDENHVYPCMIDLSKFGYHIVYEKDSNYIYCNKKGICTTNVIWRKNV